MFEMKSIQQQALDLRRENAKLKTALDKTNADMEYIAMMADIELDILVNKNDCRAYAA